MCAASSAEGERAPNTECELADSDAPDASMVYIMKCAFCKFCRMSKSGVLHLQYNFQPPDGGMPPNSDSDVPNMANLFLDCTVNNVSGVTILGVEYHTGMDGSLPVHVDTNVML